MKENSKIVTVKIIKVQFPNNPMNRFDIPKFRGYMAKLYPKYTLLHNHLENGKFRYGYPQVQFKTIKKIPTIIGISEGLEILKIVFMDVEEININGRSQKIWEKSIKLREESFGQTEEYYSYQFLSPWMALKEENYETYRQLDSIEKQVFLKHLIRENLKTVSKGFQYHIPDIDSVNVEGYFKPRRMNFKNVRMLCFTGEFTVNFIIPDYLGIGKQVARGYGMVKKMMN
ncbi:MAG: hypothetical protein KAW56_02635 [Candidatus Marinimicrobia bacterium]|nr:hypothetical protein [Candidatus Neomarinimicrobiota bacterium]